MFNFGLTTAQEERAKRLHKESIVIDMLCVQLVNDSYFHRSKQGGVTAGSHCVLGEGLTTWTYEAAVTGIAEYLDIFREKPDKFLHVTSVSDIRRAKAEGKFGIILSFQNSACLGDDLGRLGFFKKMGVWVIQLTYNHQGLVGSGFLERGDYGLSEFGIWVVHQMNELGMVVDLGHANNATTLDAIEFSKKPITISHGNIRALCNTPRNYTDEALKALASKGGVIGISTIPGFMSETGYCTINDFLDHIDYAVKLMGVEHVGIGGDFPTGRPPGRVYPPLDWGPNQELFAKAHVIPEIYPTQQRHEGFEDESKFPNVTRGLVSRGYRDDEITKILGGNWLRLLEEVRG